MNSVFKSLLARLLWRTGLLALTGMVRRAIRGPRLIILCYHRIDANPALPALSATPQAFADQVSWFARRFKVLGLDDVSGYLKNRVALKRDAIALTFDDGYADNYRIVLPMLNRFKLPAAFFISTDPLLRRIPYWYDVLWTRLMNWTGGEIAESESSALPENLRIVLKQAAVNPGKSSLQKILDVAKGLNTVNRKRLMDGLGKLQRPGTLDAVCETLEEYEMRNALAQGVLLGGHTGSHPSLARISREECQSEIINSWQELSVNGFAPRYFAYPFGEASDVGGFSGYPRQVLLELNGRVSKNGIKLPALELALTTEERAVRREDDRLLVPRKVISPQTLPQIALKLEMLAWRK